MKYNIKNISPIDGRYSNQISHLSEYFSEYALIKERVKIEILYIKQLSEWGICTIPSINLLDSIYLNFNENEANIIKEIENKTNHDIKAIEYYIKRKMKYLSLSDYTQWIHFGLTSQDINNTAVPCLWLRFITDLYIPTLQTLIVKLKTLAYTWWKVPMLSRTHGQPASPTTMGKEIMVFVERLENQIILLNNIPHTGKFGGAVGNFNAHYIAFPKINWNHFADEFLKQKLSLKRQQYTTQIEHYDNLSASFDTLKRINTILLDLSKDMWQYISYGYFKLETKEDEIGSSVMPHKVNPINFENAEGNLGIANANFEFLSSKLPVSRLQRDLSDSTAIRNIGVPIAHTFIALNSINTGLKRLVIDKHVMSSELENNWCVITEAIQTILRREGHADSYEIVKSFSKSFVNKEKIRKFISELDIKDSVKTELLNIVPQTYLGTLL